MFSDVEVRLNTPLSLVKARLNGALCPILKGELRIGKFDPQTSLLGNKQGRTLIRDHYPETI